MKLHGILLVGPTGSGKTPLGDLLEASGMHGNACRHFDFGRELRILARQEAPPSAFSADDLHFIRQVLDAGRLLENENFYLVEKIIASFMRRKNPDAGGILLLNGMPRHMGQARDMDRFVAIREVIQLACSAEVVYERIRRNTGGDRARRQDDGPGAVRKKLDVFSRRTIPLIDHYRRQGAMIRKIPVQSRSTAQDMVQCYHSLAVQPVEANHPPYGTT